jgi:hypothetical protein
MVALEAWKTWTCHTSYFNFFSYFLFLEALLQVIRTEDVLASRNIFDFDLEFVFYFNVAFNCCVCKSLFLLHRLICHLEIFLRINTKFFFMDVFLREIIGFLFLIFAFVECECHKFRRTDVKSIIAFVVLAFVNSP